MSNRTDIVVETDNAEGQVLLSASRVYDLTEDKTQDTINGEIKNTLNQLDGAKAAKVDLTNISQSTPNCTVTNGIAKGTYFYLDGVLTRATAAISENAPFTSSNCETVTAGGLNDLKNTFVLQPDVLHLIKKYTFSNSGDLLTITSEGGWYAVRAVNQTTAGITYAYMSVDVDVNNYIAAAQVASGSYQRVMTPWIYFPAGKVFYARAGFTESSLSGVFFAPATWGK